MDKDVDGQKQRLNSKNERLEISMTAKLNETEKWWENEWCDSPVLGPC